MSADRRLLAKLHCAKRDLALDDDTYRDVLERVTGKRSAAELGDAGVIQVLEELRRRGWTPPAKSTRASDKPDVRKVWALWGQMVRDGIAHGGRDGLRTFVKRMTNVEDPEWLTSEQARTVIESLKSWRARELATQRRKAKAPPT